MNASRIVLAALAAAGLAAACSRGPDRVSALTNPAPCPYASVLFDAARIVNFHGEQRLADVGFTGEILGVRSLCRYRDDGGPIESDLEIDFGFGRGAAAAGNAHAYQYFVAVTRRDAAVIHKEVFPIQANFRNSSVVYQQDRIRRITIPRVNDTISGENFEIVIGFELTPDQLAFNRSGVRFRTTAGEFAAPGS